MTLLLCVPDDKWIITLLPTILRPDTTVLVDWE